MWGLIVGALVVLVVELVRRGSRDEDVLKSINKSWELKKIRWYQRWK